MKTRLPPKSLLELARNGAALAAAITCLTGEANAADHPAAVSPLTYSGRLEDPSGAPLAGTSDIEVILWDATQANAPLCSTGPQSITLANGRFSLDLPADCAAKVQGQPRIFTEVVVNGQALGKSPVGVLPYAVESQHAALADSASGELATTLADLRTRLANLEDALKQLQSGKADRAQTGSIGANVETVKGFPPANATVSERSHDIHVTFPTPYSKPPQVSVAISHLDSDGRTNTRLRADVLAVDPNGFDVRILTWADSQVYGVTVSWVAIPAP